MKDKRRKQYIVPFTEAIQIIDAEDLLKIAPQTGGMVDNEPLGKEDDTYKDSEWGDAGDID